MNTEDRLEALAVVLYTTSMMAIRNEETPKLDYVSRWKNPKCLIPRDVYRVQAQLLLGLFSAPNNIMEVKDGQG